MRLSVSINGDSSGFGFLMAPIGNQVFPVPLAIRTEDGSSGQVTIEVSSQGAAVQLERTSLSVGPQETIVQIHASSASAALNDIVLEFSLDYNLDVVLNLTSIANPRIWFDGRFEVRFSTGAGFYNAPRGGDGWMWLLEDEPDFCPADPALSVPDRIDKTGTGRVIRFHEPVLARPHVPPIGVFVRAVDGEVGGSRMRFTSGDPVIGLPVSLGPDTYFASNRPVSPDDRAAGRLPEEQHPDGRQPLANFKLCAGELFSGSSRVGPFVPGTTESRTPRNPDFRPFGQGLQALTPGESAAYPFLPLAEFEETRVNELIPDFVALKEAAQTDTVAFRNLRTRIGHLLPRIDPTLRSQLLTDHADVGLTTLSPSADFGWGMKETYRGTINHEVTIPTPTAGVMSYFSRFDSYQFLCVFFNFHTDEDCGHVYGAMDPSVPPPTV